MILMLYRSQLDWIILHILSVFPFRIQRVGPAEKRVGIDDRMVEFGGKFGVLSVLERAKIKGEKVGSFNHKNLI